MQGILKPIKCSGMIRWPDACVNLSRILILSTSISRRAVGSLKMTMSQDLNVTPCPQDGHVLNAVSLSVAHTLFLLEQLKCPSSVTLGQK